MRRDYFLALILSLLGIGGGWRNVNIVMAIASILDAAAARLKIFK